MMKRINWEWIRKQLEALPYILGACLVGGWMWLMASMAVILFD